LGIASPAIAAPLALAALGSLLAIAGLSLAAMGTLGNFSLSLAVGIDQIGAFVITAVAVFVIATPALIVEAGAALAQHTKIMVGELQKIFGLDAVAAELRVARHALVFFEQLGGIAALPVVLAIATAS
jgi:hypothetical protein